MSDLLPVPPPLGWRARLEALLGGRPLTAPRVAIAIGGALVASVVAAVVVIWVLRTPPPTETLIPQVTTAGDAAPSADEERSLMVQAAGAVIAPGVYRLPANARVIDLIDAAGGLAPAADADRLALAAKVSDGERVYVPKVGEALPASAGSGSVTPAGPLDLNAASESDLDALPGIGPATAAAIVTYRERHGPFRSVDQLLEVRGIGPAKLDQLTDLVRV